jgi:hypothetical protein
MYDKLSTVILSGGKLFWVCGYFTRDFFGFVILSGGGCEGDNPLAPNLTIPALVLLLTICPIIPPPDGVRVKNPFWR